MKTYGYFKKTDGYTEFEDWLGNKDYFIDRDKIDVNSLMISKGEDFDIMYVVNHEKDEIDAKTITHASQFCYRTSFADLVNNRLQGEGSGVIWYAREKKRAPSEPGAFVVIRWGYTDRCCDDEKCCPKYRYMLIDKNDVPADYPYTHWAFLNEVPEG